MRIVGLLITGQLIIVMVLGLLFLEPSSQVVRGYTTEPRCEFTFVHKFEDPKWAALVVYNVTERAPRDYLPVQVFQGALTMRHRHGHDGPQLRRLTPLELELTRECLRTISAVQWAHPLPKDIAAALEEVLNIVRNDDEASAQE